MQSVLLYNIRSGVWHFLHLVSANAHYILHIHVHLIFRADVSARTSGISGSCQQKFKTWKEAHDVYARCYQNGTVRATPLVNGPFDPYRAGDGEEDDLVDALSRTVIWSVTR